MFILNNSFIFEINVFVEYQQYQVMPLAGSSGCVSSTCCHYPEANKHLKRSMHDCLPVHTVFNVTVQYVCFLSACVNIHAVFLEQYELFSRVHNPTLSLPRFPFSCSYSLSLMHTYTHTEGHTQCTQIQK